MSKRLNLISKTDDKPKTKKEKLLSKVTDTVKKITNFISSGCHIINLALTGNLFKAYPVGRIVIAKGEHSTGKTVLALEAINSLEYIEKSLKGKKVAARYNDAEAALDPEFSEDLNLPEGVELVEPPTETVEEFHQDLDDFISRHKDCDVTIYVLDSLDALMVREEQEEVKKNLNKIKKKRLKALGEKDESAPKEEDDKATGSYGAQKAKYMSKLFRDIKNKLKKSNCILFIVAQLRDDLKKKYGNTSTMSGGKAAGFYASQIIDVSKVEILKVTKETKISYGSKAKIKVAKNKVWKDKREAFFDIITNPTSGIDNYGSVIDFMVEQGEIPYSMKRYVWKDEKYSKDKLIEFFHQNKEDWKELLEATQLVWDKLEEEASVSRPNKWENMVIE